MAFKEDIEWVKANEPVQGDVDSAPGQPALEGVSNRPGKEIQSNASALRNHFVENLWENETVLDNVDSATTQALTADDFLVVKSLSAVLTVTIPAAASSTSGDRIRVKVLKEISGGSVTVNRGVGALTHDDTLITFDGSSWEAEFTGAYGEKGLLDGAVTTDKLGASSVTTAKINNNAVNESKIANNAVASHKLANSAVTTAKINDGAVTEPKLADGAVTENKIANNAVTTAKLNNNAVTSAKIANNAVTEGKIASGAVTENKIANNAVTGDKINAGAVTSNKLANNAVTSDKIANSAITGDKIANNAITESKIGVGAISERNLSSAVSEFITTSGTAEWDAEVNYAHPTMTLAERRSKIFYAVNNNGVLISIDFDSPTNSPTDIVPKVLGVYPELKGSSGMVYYGNSLFTLGSYEDNAMRQINLDKDNNVLNVTSLGEVTGVSDPGSLTVHNGTFYVVDAINKHLYSIERNSNTGFVDSVTDRGEITVDLPYIHGLASHKGTLYAVEALFNTEEVTAFVKHGPLFRSLTYWNSTSTTHSTIGTIEHIGLFEPDFGNFMLLDDALTVNENPDEHYMIEVSNASLDYQERDHGDQGIRFLVAQGALTHNRDSKSSSQDVGAIFYYAYKNATGDPFNRIKVLHLRHDDGLDEGGTLAALRDGSLDPNTLLSEDNTDYHIDVLNKVAKSATLENPHHALYMEAPVTIGTLNEDGFVFLGKPNGNGAGTRIMYVRTSDEAVLYTTHATEDLTSSQTCIFPFLFIVESNVTRLPNWGLNAVPNSEFLGAFVLARILEDPNSGALYTQLRGYVLQLESDDTLTLHYKSSCRLPDGILAASIRVNSSFGSVYAPREGSIAMSLAVLDNVNGNIHFFPGISTVGLNENTWMAGDTSILIEDEGNRVVGDKKTSILPYKLTSEQPTDAGDTGHTRKLYKINLDGSGNISSVVSAGVESEEDANPFFNRQSMGLESNGNRLYSLTTPVNYTANQRSAYINQFLTATYNLVQEPRVGELVLDNSGDVVNRRYINNTGNASALTFTEESLKRSVAARISASHRPYISIKDSGPDGAGAKDPFTELEYWEEL